MSPLIARLKELERLAELPDPETGPRARRTLQGAGYASLLELAEALYACETVMMIVAPRSDSAEYHAAREQARTALANLARRLNVEEKP